MIRKTLSLLGGLLITGSAMAQSHITLNTPNASGTYNASGSITLAPGFSASGVTTFWAYIIPSAGRRTEYQSEQ